jgi:raffinose synthase
VLDDGWQSVGHVDAPNGKQWRDRLTTLTANHKFEVLGKTVKLAKEKYGVDNFLVWHAVQGYWQGVDADHPGLQRFKPEWRHMVVPPGVSHIDPEMRLVQRISSTLVSTFAAMKRRYGFGLVPPAHISAFYEEYHAYLSDQGVDGIKVDAQSILNCLGEGQGGSVALTHACQSALSSSVHKHFNGPNIIHCMCHDSAMILQLPQHYDGGVRPVIRGSDDFYPRDAASHGTHIYANAFNSLLLAHCGALQVRNTAVSLVLPYCYPQFVYSALACIRIRCYTA